MKTKSILLGCALLCLACQPKAEQVTGPSNAARMAKLYEAFAMHDVPTVVAGMDPGIVWNEAENFPYADENPYIGPDAVVNGVFGRLGAEWDNFRLEMTQFHELDSDGVLVTGRYRGTYKATGKQLDAQFAHVWKLKDTLAVSFQQYTDTWQAAEATAPMAEAAAEPQQ